MKGHIPLTTKVFFGACFAFLFFTDMISCQFENEIPKVSLVNVKLAVTAATKNLTLNLKTDSSGAKHILELTKDYQSMFLNCESRFPVQWSYRGIAAPLQINVTSYRKWRNETEIFLSELFIVRVSSHLTGEWRCNLVHDHRIQNSVFIFAEEHGYRGEDPFFLEYGKQREIYAKPGESIVFPCLSYKRNVEAKLAKQIRRGEVKIYEELDKSQVDYQYDPTIGFTILLSNAHPWGKYICYTQFNKTFDRVTILLKQDLDVKMFPEDEEVEILEGQILNLNCSTNNPRLKLEMLYPEGDNRMVLFKPQSSGGSDAAQLTLHNATYRDEGSVSCNAIDTLGKIVLTHTWTYRIISTHDRQRRGWSYYFSQRLKEHTWVCWSKSSKIPSISYVQCTNPMECQVRSACFKLGTQCDAVAAAKSCSGGCVRLPLQKTPGRLTCSGDGLKNAELSVFIGVSGSIYNKTNDLTKDSIVASYNTGNQTYRGTMIDLSCIGSSFFFSLGFYWNILISSEKSFRLDNDTRMSEGVATLSDYFEHFDRSSGIITLTSKVKVLSTEVVQISCMAPLWDSINVSEFAMNVTVKVPTPPKIEKVDEDVDFDLGDINQSIFCEASGVPKPKITWTKDGKNLPSNLIVVEDEGETLFFDEVTLSHHGSYECQATNPGGIAIQKFTVTVSDSNEDIILWITIPGVIFIIILFIVLALFWRRIQRQKKMLRNLTDAEIEEFLYGNPDQIDGYTDTNKQGHLLAYNRDYEFPKDFLEIQMEEKLGSGAYGLVIKGTAKGLFPGEEETLVAIKTLQPQADITHFKALLIELKIMSFIGRNPFIVNLLGACTTEIKRREIYIIVEYCENGSLEKFLKTHRGDFPSFQNPNVRYSVEPQRATAYYQNQPGASTLKITTDTLLKWCYEISAGMEYLASKKVIHGDLAARNILLTDQLFAKIGDFGLSRQLYEYTNYVKKQQAPLPWRWLAIESLCDMEFSHKSDVWSLGITFWEIFSLGEIPYPGLVWDADFMLKLRQGNRPPKPDLASDTVYNQMIDCWRYMSADRPSFTELKTFFCKTLQQRGVPIMEPPHAPLRRKHNLEITNQNYGIDKEKINENNEI